MRHAASTCLQLTTGEVDLKSCLRVHAFSGMFSSLKQRLNSHLADPASSTELTIALLSLSCLSALSPVLSEPHLSGEFAKRLHLRP